MLKAREKKNASLKWKISYACVRGVIENIFTVQESSGCTIKFIFTQSVGIAPKIKICVIEVSVTGARASTPGR